MASEAATEGGGMSAGERPLHRTTSMAHWPQLSNLGGNLDICEKIVELVKSTWETKTKQVRKQNNAGKI